MTELHNSLNLTGRQIIDSIQEGIFVTDAQGIITAVNPAFCQITGYSVEEAIGKNPRLLKSGKHDVAFYAKLWRTITTIGFWKGEIWNRRKDGTNFAALLTVSAVKNGDDPISHFIGAFLDVTHAKKTETTLVQMSLFDPLTKLPNRALFRDRLKQAITQAERNKKVLAVLFLDLDRVKLINDTLGHDSGDRMLTAVARRLESSLREADTIARLGGDVFMILFPGLNQPEDVPKLTEKILGSLKMPFMIDNQELFITASVGISVYPFDGHDANTLLRHADTAMYRAKGQGRNNYQMFTPDMTSDDFEQLSIGNSLRRALDRNEFVLHYQPQMNLETGEIVGMEALIRWQHPDMGLLHPSRFIHWAEETGLIVPIGEWVLQEAARQNKEWQNKGLPRLRVSVNLSALQFRQKNLVESITRVLQDTNLAPDCLELELTETVVMENAGPSIYVPHRLRAMGVRFSIDDFGTGYSSLNYLKRFPANTIKMDRSFINELTLESKDAAIAQAVITLGHGLNLTVLAEGVETEGQLSILKEFQCDSIQGFLFSHPLPSDQLESLLHDNHRFGEKTLFNASRPPYEPSLVN